MQQVVQFAEMSLRQLRMVLDSFYGPHVLVCMPDNVGDAPDKMIEGVLGCLLPDHDITKLLDGLRYNLVASIGPKCDVPEMFYWANQ